MQDRWPPTGTVSTDPGAGMGLSSWETAVFSADSDLWLPKVTTQEVFQPTRTHPALAPSLWGLPGTVQALETQGPSRSHLEEEGLLLSWWRKPLEALGMSHRGFREPHGRGAWTVLACRPPAPI